VDPWAYTPVTTGGPAITFCTDLDATCTSIAAACGQRDADAYHRLITEWTDPAERLLRTFQDPPSALRIARRMRGLARQNGGAETARRFLQPGNHLLDSYFRNERLKAVLAWLAAQSGPPPHEPATAGQLTWLPLLHQRPPGRPVGGSGRLADALAERLRRLRGEVRLGDGAVQITRHAGRVDGVRTSSGEHIKAAAVLAGCHILTTMDLLGHTEKRDRIRVGDGIGLAVRLGTTALPPYPDVTDPAAYHALQPLLNNRRQLSAAYGDFLAGRLPEQPPVLAMTFSALDPTLAPAGRHGVTLWSQWHRYDLADGRSWDSVRDEAARRVIDQVERFASGFTATIEHMHVQTPLDFERELGLCRGNVMHVEMGVDAMFALRPLPGLAGYRGPVPGLYLTGASTHPGGGVFGASGRLAAQTLLADRRSRWRRGVRFAGS
jgi:phytoene dehydrogenase-like protein